MNRPKFTCIFANEMNVYLDYKVSSGYQEKSFYTHLRCFDRFCIEHALSTPAFTRELADEWTKKRENESNTTHYSRINGIKQFLIYLSKKGYNVFVTRDISFRQTQFQPHIYTDDEIQKYFSAVDTFDSSKNKKDKIQYPVLFRILYCCGTRINETLGIRKQDVDLDAGIIKLSETKNDCDRYIVLSDELRSLIKQYASKCFYLLNEEDYIFTLANGKRCSGDIIYEHHRMFLKKAGIPYIGNGEGPRIHDFRHTFAVNSFKQMLDTGIDMYVALPILSTYLGHKTIYATERYVRLTMSMFPYIEKQFKDKMDAVFGEANHENN
ncbi:tyrosine-type recombinase/integrase [Thermoanaerobacterium thermosaccharolyticum]|uniref:Site-specific recombinase XerD n=1 Tax=Thermoanaerobacterium thermosaccharolyticum M0795 TaxID=698948 RepID=L0IF22_THETR|nr:tyrosine-type recombinase/integrase [Thermoanaerobacterium thermosaccharolyticum]AGB18155.1 site-specific recombinase XerD [Thermoanaerobacterium thermosaccharolyticum M0795]